ncbi:MAG TPA: lactate utilization protein [Alphaproteobacteria bacterium]|nr:lactate utilization protein [Alphaproteobacteria bacterium]
MSDERQAILASIARALRREGPEADAHAELELRLSQPKPNLIPRRAADLPHPERVALFATMAREADATLAELPSAEAAPAAIADYLRRENLPPELRIAPDPVLEKLPWSALPLLSVSYGRATGAEAVSVTSAFAGIAETGTLMLTSGPTMPTTLNFLPDTNIVLLRAARIVGAYEEAWTLLRQTGAMPRTVNFITGPSRSADIEQTLQLGAHGPRRLHILLIHAGPAD